MSEEPKQVQLEDFSLPYDNNNEETVVLREHRFINDGKKTFQFSKSPANVSLVESWSAFHHGRSLRYMKQNMKWKYVVFFLIVIFFISFMIWECFSYFHLKAELDSTVKDLHAVSMRVFNLENMKSNEKPEPRYKLAKYTGEAPEPKKVKKSFAAIRRCGMAGQTEVSKSGDAFSLWNTTLTIGDIQTSHEYIVINKPGVYYVYAQMYFYGNKSFRKPFLHFFIRKNRSKILTVASMPRTSCVPFCTRYISSVIDLKEGDDLSVASADTGISFKMSCDKAMFGAYMLVNNSKK